MTRSGNVIAVFLLARAVLACVACSGELGTRRDATSGPDGQSPERDSGVLADAKLPDFGTLPQRSCMTEFRYRPLVPIKALYLIGDWDGWTVDHPMTDPNNDGVYSVSLQLPAGFYGYRFKLIDPDGGETFVRDPENAYHKYDDGVENSGARVADCSLPLIERRSLDRKADGVDARFAFFRGHGGAALSRYSVSLVHEFQPRQLTDKEATLVAENELRVTIQGLPAGKYTLRIEAQDQDGKSADSLIFPFWVEGQRFDWNGALLYMVMVDRFRDGDPQNNPPAAPDASPSADYHGGDLQGLASAIGEGYFEKLGVRAIWVSPLNRNTARVFVEHDHGVTGYHGYWPVAGREVEPRFGGPEALEQVVTAAHRRGIRVLLDFVLNHVHEDHDYFKSHPDWFRTGCVCGEPNCDWTARRLDCLFAPYMPDVNWEQPQAGEQFISDALFWLERFDLDGLRVDAVKHVEDLAVFNLSTRVHERFEQAGTEYFLLGETAMGWGGDAVRDSEQDYATISRYIDFYGLNGQFDFVLYHAVAYRVFAYSEKSMIHADYWTLQSLLHYPQGAIMTPYLSSHDTSRFVSQAMYRDPSSRHMTDNKWPDDGGGLPLAPDSDEPYQRLAVGLTWLFTLPGAPLLYYGDEYGEFGGSDPDNRHMFRPESQRNRREKAVFERIAAAGRARAALPALQRGDYRSIAASTDFLCFSRSIDDQTVLVLLNRSSADTTQRIVLPEELHLAANATLEDKLSSAGQRYPLAERVLELTVPAWGTLILAP